jgi:hypothetical protein
MNKVLAFLAIGTIGVAFATSFVSAQTCTAVNAAGLRNAH